ncbi:MAG: T9SS type A sorting domain-containing protein, partial [Candidatus Marinimicrobia bacterium]|nr:T9SS type A sorting domain-containing protein [Candidatus Neomarinimicrobiota bacterium]
WWGSPYTAGDEILFVYANPIQQGVDTYSFTTTAPAEFTIAKGDVNNDGDVNISDVVMLINYLLQISDLETDAQMYAADHNGDYAINIADAVSIIQDILNRSGKLLASTSPAENSLISLSETAIIYENEIQLPMTLTADGDISALQVELTYDHQILVPDTPVLNGGSWNDINVLYTSSQPGKVIYLFYSLGGSTLPIAEDLIFPFRNITGDENVSTKISLTQAVVAGSNGRSTVLEYGNRTAKTNAVPETYSLYPNYPNPFNPVTNIEFDLPEVSLVTIHVYNILGQQVRTLIDGNKIAGHHRIQWDGRNTYGESLASGVYFVRFKANEFLQNQKIMLLK